MPDSRGSRWLKWDLHIHSKFSRETRAKMEIEDIFDKAIMSEISVIAITDHSNVDSLDDIWETYEKEKKIDEKIFRYRDLIQFLPGIELKTNKGNKPIHMIALFPKTVKMRGHEAKVDNAFLKNEFLAKIACTENAIKNAGNGDYTKGLFEKGVDFEKTAEMVRELGGITIIHNGTKENGFDEGLAHAKQNASPEELLNSLGAEKERLMTNYVDICEFPNWSESNLKNMDFYTNRFDKPCIVSSDSHESYDGVKFTWIKAEPTFEGLKQVLFEPRYRIYRGEKYPNEPIYQIGSVEIDFHEDTKLCNDQFCLRGKNTVNFSPNLTCFIGSRGTGKSSFLNLIHEKLRSGQNSFFKKNPLSIPDRRLIETCVRVDNDDDEKYVEFLSQNEIEEFATNHEKFTSAIFSRILKIDTNGEITEKTEKLKTYLSNLDKQIERINRKSQLTSQLEVLEKELRTNLNLVASLKDSDYIALTNVLQEKGKEIQALITSKKRLNDLLEKLGYLLKQNNFITVTEANEYDKKFNQIVHSIETEIINITNDNVYPIEKQKEKQLDEEVRGAREALKRFLVQQGLTVENLKDVSQANEKIAEITSKINSVRGLLEAVTLETESFEISNSFKTDLEGKIEEALKGITEGLVGLNEQVKPIELKYEFNEQKAKKELLDNVVLLIPPDDKNQKPRADFIERSLFWKDPKEVNEYQEFHDRFQAEKQNNKTSFALYEFFSKESNFEIYKLLINKVYSNVDQFKRIRVFYDGKPLENTSFGQRCTAAIVILLILGNNPIIIDEPEAHLDSSLIAKYLVELVKNRKQSRQIIFATHNANFVVNGDSELIHILEMDDEKRTVITASTIENLEHRDKLLMLEGGQKAFEQREKRYQFKLYC